MTLPQIRAPEAFRRHFAGRQAREATDRKLGAWCPPADRSAEVRQSSEQPDGPTTDTYTKGRTRSDPYGRADRKAARDRARAQLKADYQAYRREWIAGEGGKRGTEGAHMKAAMAEIAARRRERARAIRARRLPRVVRQVALSVIAAEAIQARAVLRAEMAEARRERSPYDYRRWVEDRAAEGRADAIAQLRGFHYAEQRRSAREARSAGEGEAIGGSSSSRCDPAGPREFGSSLSDARALSWTVDRQRGYVEYRLAGERAFIDEGPVLRLAAQPEGTADRSHIRVALQLAVQKWGRELSLGGSEAFRRAVIEEAVGLGLQVKFKSPEDERYRQQRAAEREAIWARRAEPVPSYDPLEGFRRVVAEAEQAADTFNLALAKARLAVAQEYQAAGRIPTHYVSDINAEAQRRAIEEWDQRQHTARAEQMATVSPEAAADAHRYVNDFRLLASRRSMKMHGYGDGQEIWAGLPEYLRDRIEQFNALPADEKQQAAEQMTGEAAQRYSEDPQAAERESLAASLSERGQRWGR